MPHPEDPNTTPDSLPHRGLDEMLVPKGYRRHVIQVASVALILWGLFAYTSSWSAAGLLLWQAVMPTLAVSVGFYGAWWAFFDYKEADQQRLFAEALKGNIAAAIVAFIKPFVFAVIVWAMMAGIRPSPAHAVERVDRVPPQAMKYLPIVMTELRTLWPDIPEPAYIPALIHHESGCPALRSCWSPTAKLDGRRKDGSKEEGAGWPQLTRAWRADGTLRFDVIAELRRNHPKTLAELTWETVYSRPDMQARALILIVHRHYFIDFADVPEATRFDFVDPAYNGGPGHTKKERAACARATDCDPDEWWGNVELHCVKSKAPLYGTRSACDINRHHVVAVRRHAQPAYEPLMRRGTHLGARG